MPDEASGAIEPHVFRNVIGRFLTGVTVLTVRRGDVDYGMTASAISSLSLEPPMLVVCVNRNHPTRHAIADSGAFVVNVLAEGQARLARHFATPQDDKFAGVHTSRASCGAPLLREALAHLECRVSETVEATTHTVYLAVVAGAHARHGAPLAYFAGRFGRIELEDDAAYAELRRLVLDRETALDRPLAAEEVAGALGVASEQADELLVRLADEGRLRRTAPGRYQVAPIDIRAIAQSFRAACAIELGAAQQTVGQCSRQQLAELRRRMAATLAHVRDDRILDRDRFFAADRALHEHMVEVTGGELLVAAYRALDTEGILHRSFVTSDLASPDALADHEQLVEAYEREDLEKARAVIRRHSERSIDLAARATTQAERDDLARCVGWN